MKNNKGYIFLVLFIIISLTMVALYDKIIPKETKTKIDSKKQIIEENIDEIGTSLLEIVKEYELYTYADNIGIISFNNNISPQQIKSLYYYFIDKNIPLTKQNVDNYLYELYGEKTSEYPDIIFDGLTEPAAVYDKKSEKYLLNEAVNIQSVKPIEIIKDKAEKIGDNYIITVSYLYQNEQLGYYSDPSYNYKIEKLNSELDRKQIIDFYHQNYETVKTKPYYKYTFEKKDGKYNLKIYEREE